MPGKFDTLEKAVDINKPNFLTIIDFQNNILSRAEFPTPGKTIYLNWDPAHKPYQLYPQRGKLMGLFGETDLGYKTKNNVDEKKDIRRLPIGN